MSLTVTPDLQIYLKCPEKVEKEKIDDFLTRKWFWLEKQLNFFKKYQRKLYQKEYVSGEGFLYLGRQYKLLVKRGNDEGVSLSKGMLTVHTKKSVQKGEYTKKLLDTWYRERTVAIFADRLEKMAQRFNYKKTPVLVIREMQRRWGSCLNREKILLNPKLIHVPKECIDYVVIHELCHVRYKNHDARFWQYLSEKCPKWETLKDRLETIGADVR